MLPPLSPESQHRLDAHTALNIIICLFIICSSFLSCALKLLRDCCCDIRKARARPPAWRQPPLRPFYSLVK